MQEISNVHLVVGTALKKKPVQLLLAHQATDLQLLGCIFLQFKSVDLHQLHITLVVKMAVFWTGSWPLCSWEMLPRTYKCRHKLACIRNMSIFQGSRVGAYFFDIYKQTLGLMKVLDKNPKMDEMCHLGSDFKRYLEYRNTLLLGRQPSLFWSKGHLTSGSTFKPNFANGQVQKCISIWTSQLPLHWRPLNS